MTRNHARHAIFFGGVLAVLVLGAVLMQATVVAATLAAAGVLIALLMAVAWARPRGYPLEHHPKVDRFVDDTRP